MEENKILKEMKKNKFKPNKLILYVYSNTFYLFFSIMIKGTIFILNSNPTYLSF